jgi:hypothetical protein
MNPHGEVPHPDQIVAIHKALVEGGDFGPIAIAKAASDFYGELPHPGAPQLKVKEYPAFERVAWMLNDRAPTGHDVAHAHESLKQAGMSPAEFEGVWSTARPVANRLIGEDPKMQDLVRLKDAHPHEIHAFYMDHPYPGYEEVTAGQMARYYRASEAIARRYGRTPNLEEVSRFASAGYEDEHIETHYSEGSRSAGR